MRRLAIVVVALAGIAGCGDTINNFGSDGGSSGDAAGSCTPNTKECVTSRVARICAADGSGWVPQQCDFGDICTGGDCMPDPNAACVPGDGACIDATHALLCNDNGMGFMTKACPANTQCAGPGVCVGNCIVGEAICLDSNTVATCADGQKLTTTSCSVGTTACVSTGTTPFQTAACKPAQCAPLPTGCDTVCGNKSAGSSNTDPNFLSFCQETPNGYQWVAVQCQTGGTCNPFATVCGGGLYAAACTVECTPGQTRCDNVGTSIQTCGTNGHWGATTSCTPDQTGRQQVCLQNIFGVGQAICGDEVCGFAPGACEADGFHACVNGRVAATATACATGTCIPTGGATNGYTPGQCGAQCQTGEQRCASPNGSQSCVNGLWGPTITTCASGTCQQFVDATNGLSKTVCGVCAPGTHRCTNSGGTPTAPTSTHIELCLATGQYGTAAACVVGLCNEAFSGSNNFSDAGCIAECIPNSLVCVGGTKGGAAANPTHPGTTAVGTCTPAGLLPPPPSCPTGTGCCPGTTSCRTGPSGKPVVSTNTPPACVDCVGPMITGGNEAGLVDTRCSSATALQTCQNDNTWGAASTCTTSCSAETGAIGIETCQTFNGTPISDSFFAGLFGTGVDCTAVFGSPSAPCGGVADCCSNTCNLAPPPPTPGFCQ